MTLVFLLRRWKDLWLWSTTKVSDREVETQRRRIYKMRSTIDSEICNASVNIVNMFSRRSIWHAPRSRSPYIGIVRAPPFRYSFHAPLSFRVNDLIRGEHCRATFRKLFGCQTIIISILIIRRLTLFRKQFIRTNSKVPKQSSLVFHQDQENQEILYWSCLETRPRRKIGN